MDVDDDATVIKADPIAMETKLPAATVLDDTIIEPDPIALNTEIPPVSVWLADNFSEYWFKDAHNESVSGADENSIRREILFAVCFLESYIFEWTRRLVDIEEISEYFPSKSLQNKDSTYRRWLRKVWSVIFPTMVLP